MMPDRAVVFDADGARDGQASVGMHEQFYRISEFFSDQVSKIVYFFVRLVDVEIPRYCQVAIDVQRAAILDDPDIVNIDPVFAAFTIQRRDHLAQQFIVAFIHNAGDGSANDLETCVKDDAAKKYCYSAVKPRATGQEQQHKTRKNT